MSDPPRSSGVHLHVTSLPGGTLGCEAYRFVDWLAAAGQSWWQVLPLGPPDRYGSPYMSRSAFAAWPGFLDERARRSPVRPSEIVEFSELHAFWARDWHRLGGRGALADQVRFQREWQALRGYAAERGVRLLGDVAIYVAPGSVDHRAHPELFASGGVAGAPPDAYSETGQLWGNPLYDWPALRRRRYRWWVERLRRVLELFDLVRIDHFRGFVAYWAVPDDALSAVEGRWRRGPGRAPFDAIATAIGGLPLLVEDLGVITPAVERLRDTLRLPGMIVLQFGFDPEDPDGPHRPQNHHEYRFIYTGTHDQDTIRGWYEGVGGDSRALVDDALATAGFDDRERWWALIRLAMSSPARVAMVQAQDVLGLDSRARMNDPALRSGNWRWRMEAGQLTPALARRLREVSKEAGRLSA